PAERAVLERVRAQQITASSASNNMPVAVPPVPDRPTLAYGAAAPLAAAASPPAVTAASANGNCIVVNGDFETGTLAGWTLENSGSGGNFVLNNGSFVPNSGDGPHPPCQGN